MQRSSIKAKLSRLLPAAWMISHGGGRHARLALTFDDGPDAVHTPRLLDMLAHQGVRATFFLIGEHVERLPAIAQRIADEGHELGNHSYRHDNFAALPLQAQLEEIRVTEALLGCHDRAPRRYFRPPQGRLNLSLLAALAWRSYPIAMWSYDSGDWRAADAIAILERFADASVRNGDIILFHDDNDRTLAALTQLLPVWRDQGFAFVTLSELARG